MKSRIPCQAGRIHWRWASLLGAILATPGAPAAETNATPETASAGLTPEQMFEGGTNTYNNWVDLSAGGFLTGGNKAQAQQRHQQGNSVFGGIEDLHYQACAFPRANFGPGITATAVSSRLPAPIFRCPTMRWRWIGKTSRSRADYDWKSIRR